MSPLGLSVTSGLFLFLAREMVSAETLKVGSTTRDPAENSEVIAHSETTVKADLGWAGASADPASDNRTERRRRQGYGYGYPSYYGNYYAGGYGRSYSNYYHNLYPNSYSPAYYNGHKNGYNNYMYGNGGYRVGCWGTLCYDGKYHGNGRFNGARCVGLLCVLMYAAQGYPIHG